MMLNPDDAIPDNSSGVGKIESLENTMFPCMVCLLQQQLDRITLDMMLKHPQIINMEPFSKNKLTLNNLDDRITFMYQYAWNDV